MRNSGLIAKANTNTNTASSVSIEDAIEAMKTKHPGLINSIRIDNNMPTGENRVRRADHTTPNHGFDIVIGSDEIKNEHDKVAVILNICKTVAGECVQNSEAFHQNDDRKSLIIAANREACNMSEAYHKEDNKIHRHPCEIAALQIGIDETARLVGKDAVVDCVNHMDINEPTSLYFSKRPFGSLKEINDDLNRRFDACENMKRVINVRNPKNEKMLTYYSVDSQYAEANRCFDKRNEVDIIKNRLSKSRTGRESDVMLCGMRKFQRELPDGELSRSMPFEPSIVDAAENPKKSWIKSVVDFVQKSRTSDQPKTEHTRTRHATRAAALADPNYASRIKNPLPKPDHTPDI